MVQSKATLVSNLSLEQNILLFYGKEGWDKETYKELKKILRFKLEKKRINKLSGGEKKKAEILFTFLKPANYYLLDEPFKGLDQKSVESFLLWLNEKAKTVCIILTNNQKSIPDSYKHNWIQITEKQSKVNQGEKVQPVLQNSKQKTSLFLSFKSLYKAAPVLNVFRTFFILMSFLFASLTISFAHTDSAKYDGLLQTEPYDSLVNETISYNAKNQPYLEKIVKNEDGFGCVLTSNYRTYYFITSQTNDSDIEGNEEFSNLDFDTDNGSIILYNFSQEVEDKLDYKQMDKETFEKRLKAYSPFIQYPYFVENKKVYFISPNALVKLLSLGGICSIYTKEGTPIKEGLENMNIYKVESMNSNTINNVLQFSNTPDPNAYYQNTFIIDKDIRSYIALPFDSPMTLVGPNNLVITANTYSSVVSSDGEVHVSTGLLLNYLMMYSYHYFFFDKSCLSDSDFELTPRSLIPFNTDTLLDQYGNLCLIATLVCIIVSMLFLLVHTDAEKKIKKEYKDILSKLHKKSTFLLSFPTLLLSSVSCLLALISYPGFYCLSNSIYSIRLREYGFSIYQNYIPEAIASLYPEIDISTYTYQHLSYLLILLVFLIGFYFLLSYLRTKGRKQHDKV